MLEMFDLSGKTAVITGGAGGIGSSLALGLAKCGADILAADMNVDGFKETADEISGLGRQVYTCKMDITSEESVSDMVKEALSKFSKIDILINAAGTFARQPTDKITVEEWQKTMDVNIRGTFLSCRAVGIEMIKQGSGKIINISSVRGRFGVPHGGSDYCSSKGAVDSLTRTLACEWGRHNVLVNAIAPTVVETELTKAIFERPGAAEELKKRIPIGRWAMVEDLLGPVVFLASEASDYISGQILFVDGAMTATT